jgi:hypothetical protein
VTAAVLGVATKDQTAHHGAARWALRVAAVAFVLLAAATVAVWRPARHGWFLMDARLIIRDSIEDDAPLTEERHMDRYSYVERPYECVASWLADHLSPLGDPLPGGGRSVELRIRPGGLEVNRPVRLRVSGLVCTTSNPPSLRVETDLETDPQEHSEPGRSTSFRHGGGKRWVPARPWRPRRASST